MLVYTALGGVGLVVLLLMLVAGSIGDHDVPIHEASLDHGDLDGHGGPSPLGLRVVASFFTFFGVGGIVGRFCGLGHPASSALGVLLGLVAAAVVFRFARLLHEQQAHSGLALRDLAKRSATVITSIPEGGVGEVSLIAGGEHTTQLARSIDGNAIAAGKEVIIRRARGGQVLVQQNQDGGLE